MYEIYRNKCFYTSKSLMALQACYCFITFFKMLSFYYYKNRLTYLTVNQKDKFNIFIPMIVGIRFSLKLDANNISDILVQTPAAY